MPESVAQNPLLVNHSPSISSYVGWLDADNNFLEDAFPTEVFTIRVSAAVARFDFVSMVTATATVVTSARPTATGDAYGIILGVALDAASAAGQVIRVARQGFTFTKLEATQTTATGTYLQKGGTTAGRTQTFVPAATDIVDTALAKALSAKFTLAAVDYCPIFLIPRV